MWPFYGFTLLSELLSRLTSICWNRCESPSIDLNSASLEGSIVGWTRDTFFFFAKCWTTKKASSITLSKLNVSVLILNVLFSHWARSSKSIIRFLVIFAVNRRVSNSSIVFLFRFKLSMDFSFSTWMCSVSFSINGGETKTSFVLSLGCYVDYRLGSTSAQSFKLKV